MPSLLSWLQFQWDAAVHSGFPMFFWVQPRWSIDEMPDQTGRVILITGGNSGTGYASSKALYDKGATVYLACRDEAKARRAMRDIEAGIELGMGGVRTRNGRAVDDQGQEEGEEESESRRSTSGMAQGKGKGKGKGRLEFLELDLTDLESVEQAAEEFKRREQKLDVLFANAGIMATPEGLFTKQGYTLQFGTNCLGHHRLIFLLLPLLLSTSRSSPSHTPSRLIVLSSAGHAMSPSGGVDFASVVRSRSVDGESGSKRGDKEKDKWMEYGQSKWGDIALAKYVNWVWGPREKRRDVAAGEEVESMGDGEVVSVSIHPGMVATNLASHLSLTPYIVKWAPWLITCITRPPNVGALNQLWAATCPDPLARTLSGEYVVPFQHVGQHRPDLHDVEKVKGVWEWCAAQVKKGL